MAKNYDLFLERMKQKYNVPQTTYKPQTALQKQNAPICRRKKQKGVRWKVKTKIKNLCTIR